MACYMETLTTQREYMLPNVVPANGEQGRGRLRGTVRDKWRTGSLPESQQAATAGRCTAAEPELASGGSMPASRALLSSRKKP